MQKNEQDMLELKVMQIWRI